MPEPSCIGSVKQRVEGILAGTVEYENPFQQQDADGLRRELQVHRKDIEQGQQGACTTVSFLLARLEDATLVHALLNPAPHHVFHAWVEFGNVCVDLTKAGDKRYCLRSDFPYVIALERKYRGAETLVNLDTDGHGGPWNDVFDKPEYFDLSTAARIKASGKRCD